MASPRKPLGLAMVVCDAVHRDPLSAKRTILGAFSYLTLDTYPILFKRLAVHIALSECLGTYDFVIRLNELADQISTIKEHHFSLECNNPIEIVEFDITLMDVTFEKAGHYVVELLFEDVSILSRRIELLSF